MQMENEWINKLKDTINDILEDCADNIAQAVSKNGKDYTEEFAEICERAFGNRIGFEIPYSFQTEGELYKGGKIKDHFEALELARLLFNKAKRDYGNDIERQFIIATSLCQTAYEFTK